MVAALPAAVFVELDLVRGLEVVVVALEPLAIEEALDEEPLEDAEAADESMLVFDTAAVEAALDVPVMVTMTTLLLVTVEDTVAVLIVVELSDAVRRQKRWSMSTSSTYQQQQPKPRKLEQKELLNAC